MKHFRIIILALLALFHISAWAEEVTEKQALELAQKFVMGHTTRKSTPTVKAAGQVSGLYVFNVGDDGGFVVVSNEDRTVPILGFSESGSIDLNDLPDNMRAWLQGYAYEIEWLKSQKVQNAPNKAPRRIGSHSTDAIAPLIKTNWNQGMPYNNLCPMIDGTRTVTGCAATCVAQLMYYHKWPQGECTAIPGYTTTTDDSNGEDYELTVSGLEATTFEWDNMIANYTPINPKTGKMYLTGTDEQKQAVATLMLYCGTALQMKYGLNANGGSAAYSEDIPFALKTYFGYDGGVQHCYRKNYSYAEWVDLIYGELAANRPVALGGQSTGGGHSFICDGYRYDEGADYFHMNWGWAGSSDDYFLLSVLQPWEQGIGGSSTLDGFSFDQDAVIGIQRPVSGNADYCLSLEGLRLGGDDAKKTSKTFTRDGESGSFTGISIYYDVWNYNHGNNAYDMTVQLLDGSGNLVQTFGTVENQTMTWNQHISPTLSDLTIPQTVVDGTYYIKVMSRPNGVTDWQECFDGDAYRLTAVISGNQLTISVPILANVLPTATLTVTGDLLKGNEQTVNASITGETGSYNGNVILRVNGIAVMGKVLNIAAGENVDMQFSFIPKVGGVNKIALYNSRTGGKLIGTETEVNITDVFTLDNASDNNTVINNSNGNTANVTLSERTLYKDGCWNTICLPFGISDGDAEDNVSFSGTELAGATVMELDTETEVDGHLTGIQDKTLYLNFKTVDEIVAGTPYLIQWAIDSPILNPVFNAVTIDKTMRDVTSSDGFVTFKGTYTSQTFATDNQGVLLLGANNSLYYPQSGASIGAQRAYFQLNGIQASPNPSEGGESLIRAISLHFDDENETGIVDASFLVDVDLKNASNESGIKNPLQRGWFDLNGRRLDSKPIERGVYIYNGNKFVIK